MATVALDIPTAEWALPLLEPARYKGGSGGRSSGKSHFFAELAVEEMVCDPDLRFVCIREVQRSLKFSAKSLVESKIRGMVPDHEDHFEILNAEIRRRGGTGVMIFEGMQDHTADSLKSLEGFGRGWVEEAQSISQRSLDLLLPTIRAPGSEVWFSWNPDQPEDPVDAFFAEQPEGSLRVHSTYLDNPFCPDVMLTEAERMQRVDPERYAHIWLGKYNTRSDAQVLSGKYVADEFEPDPQWDGPYYGADWGFSQDPFAVSRSWIGACKHGDRCLFIDYEAGGIGISYDEIDGVIRSVPGAAKHTIRADAAEPGTIDHVAKRGLKIIAAPKWSGSVEDGVRYLRSFDRIVIHVRCPRTIEEARLWSYKTDRLTGDPLPKLEDKHNHWWDSIRYAHAPMIEADSRPEGAVSRPLGVTRRIVAPGGIGGGHKSDSDPYTGAVSKPLGRK
jgi:phage terminase large subunit